MPCPSSRPGWPPGPAPVPPRVPRIPHPSRQRLLLVGHEPDLGLLAARLLGAEPGSITLRKAGMALLRLPPVEVGCPLAGTARLEWLVRPKLWMARS